nr:cytochrome c biogenesis protein CcsA [Actinomycetota bacterium]
MTTLAGMFAMSVGLFAAGLSTALWAYAVRATTAAARSGRVRLAHLASLLTVAGSLGAAAVMEWALVTDDFSLRYVAENSSRGTPLLYRVTALWSALDGSLLLWLLALSAYGVLLSRHARLAGASRGRSALTCAAASAVQAVTFAFFVVSVAATRPFAQLSPAVADGRGPNPLLADHPAMAAHPPLLYLGYAGLVVPFGYALAALATGQVGDDWTRNTRRWVLVAWVCLTSGIVLGAWWSYAVLGWGGYWAWDPVENASLLPWLTATALLHALLRRRAGASPVWAVTLAAASFLLVCTGTFLTRSGVVLSVHSFTQSAVGPALLTVLVVAVAIVAALLIWRSDRLASSTHPSDRRDDIDQGAANTGAAAPVHSARGVALLLNNVLLVGLAVTVLAGTFLPVLAAVSGADVSVGAPYYDRIAVPVGLVL